MGSSGLPVCQYTVQRAKGISSSSLSFALTVFPMVGVGVGGRIRVLRQLASAVLLPMPFPPPYPTSHLPHPLTHTHHPNNNNHTRPLTSKPLSRGPTKTPLATTYPPPNPTSHAGRQASSAASSLRWTKASLTSIYYYTMTPCTPSCCGQPPGETLSILDQTNPRQTMGSHSMM